MTQSKICTKCKTNKSLDLFAKDTRLKSGHCSACKDCNKKFQNFRYASDASYRMTRNKSNKKYKSTQEHLARQRELFHQRMASDPQFRIQKSLRIRVYRALKDRNKSAATLTLLGCSINELRAHLERQFTAGMTWDNYGVKGWHIDHKKPCAAFDLSDPTQQRECFHYTNLQPLWAKDNLSKGDKFN